MNVIGIESQQGFEPEILMKLTESAKKSYHERKLKEERRKLTLTLANLSSKKTRGVDSTRQLTTNVDISYEDRQHVRSN